MDVSSTSAGSTQAVQAKPATSQIAPEAKADIKINRKLRIYVSRSRSISTTSID